MGKVIDGSWSVGFRLLSSPCLRSKPHPVSVWQVTGRYVFGRYAYFIKFEVDQLLWNNSEDYGNPILGPIKPRHYFLKKTGGVILENCNYLYHITLRNPHEYRVGSIILHTLSNRTFTKSASVINHIQRTINLA